MKIKNNGTIYFSVCHHVSHIEGSFTYWFHVSQWSISFQYMKIFFFVWCIICLFNNFVFFFLSRQFSMFKWVVFFVSRFYFYIKNLIHCFKLCLSVGLKFNVFTSWVRYLPFNRFIRIEFGKFEGIILKIEDRGDKGQNAEEKCAFRLLFTKCTIELNCCHMPLEFSMQKDEFLLFYGFKE